MERFIERLREKFNGLGYNLSTKYIGDGLVTLDLLNKENSSGVYVLTLDFTYMSFNINGGPERVDVYYFFKKGENFEEQTVRYVDEYFTTGENN